MCPFLRKYFVIDMCEQAHMYIWGGHAPRFMYFQKMKMICCRNTKESSVCGSEYYSVERFNNILRNTVFSAWHQPFKCTYITAIGIVNINPCFNLQYSSFN